MLQWFLHSFVFAGSLAVSCRLLPKLNFAHIKALKVLTWIMVPCGTAKLALLLPLARGIVARRRRGHVTGAM
jgi:hypothetical protein